ncbi:sugar-binding transcriptional regulator [Paenibacillus residui]|uniref:Sugar-binding transcriptional regulator n=1 Tax=Paenibacillus residui TaxID=629724 RepID=A0ABW3D418_9BACL
MVAKQDERIRLLVKVSTMYYLDGLNQQEISARLGISRPQISRMLSAAKAEGIVQIRVRNPFSKEQQYEKALSETFGISDVTVLQTHDNANRAQIEAQLGQAAAALMETVLRDRDTVGVMAGKAVASIADALSYFAKKDLVFVPMVGSWGTDGTTWHANSNVQTMGEKLRSKYMFLNAPTIVGSPETREALVKEKEISEVLQRAENASVAVIGIGQISEDATMVRSGHFNEEELASVRNKGAVANICTSFLDAKGNVLDVPAKDRMIGVTAEQLRNIPKVIAMAYGEEKVAAITAVLRGRWIDCLITDMNTADRVLEYHRQHRA